MPLLLRLSLTTVISGQASLLLWQQQAAEVGAPYGPGGPQISCLLSQLINSTVICFRSPDSQTSDSSCFLWKDFFQSFSSLCLLTSEWLKLEFLISWRDTPAI